MSEFAYESKDGEFDVIIVGAGLQRECWHQGIKIERDFADHGFLHVELIEQDGDISVRLHGTTLKIGIKLMLPEGHKSIRIFGAILPEAGVPLDAKKTKDKPWIRLGYCFWQSRN